MAVKMRLMRMGDKKNPMYRVVVVDSRKAATGEYIEEGKDISFRCKASAALEAGDVSVDLPGDLDTYPEGGIL